MQRRIKRFRAAAESTEGRQHPNVPPPDRSAWRTLSRCNERFRQGRSKKGGTADWIFSPSLYVNSRGTGFFCAADLRNDETFGRDIRLDGALWKRKSRRCPQSPAREGTENEGTAPWVRLDIQSA